MEKTHTRDFTQGSITKQLVVFATPLFLSSLLQIVYNMVDMMIVGQTLGKVGLSAVSVGGDVTNFLTFLAMGFSNAGQVIISQYLGAGQKEKIPRFISTMFSFLMIVAIGVGGICLFLREPIMHVMNTPPEAFTEAVNYATVSMLGMIFIYGYNIVSAVLRGMGDSMRPFIFISVAAVLNTILDIVFVMGLGLGCRGAAMATVISQGSSFLSCGIYVMRHKKNYGLDLSVRQLFRIDGVMLAKLVKLGIPMAIKNASVHVSKLFVNSWINSYGVAVSAFAGVANKIGSTANLVSNSFNAAGSSMVGQNIGARKYERVKGIMLAVFRVTVSAAILFSICMYAFPRQIFSCFTKDAEVIKVGMRYLPISILLFFGSAARSGMNALINGSGNYRVNFATAIFDGIIMRIGLAVLFGLVLDMEAMGFWLGDALAGFTPFWIGIVFYFSGKWKREVTD
ncbi:putative efflux protein, MATE family [Lachnospiraceae bacterium XBB1006]|nr:putative efflux protein, MATE family [Lachnospiraceae bacterium XBB1006]